MRISSILVASVVCISGWSMAGVYDTAKVWWHFDGDLNTNGLVDSGEVRDQLGWGTLATPQSGYYHGTTIYGQTNSVTWTNCLNTSNISAWDCGGLAIQFDPTINPTNATLCSPSGVLIPSLALQGSCTLVMRLRWNGFVDATKYKNAWFYNNAFKWNNSGWLVGINDNGVLTVYGGETNGYRSLSSSLADYTVRSNEWYNIAIVMTANDGGTTRTNDLFEFYVWNKTGVLNYQSRTANFLSAPITASMGTALGAENKDGNYTSGNAFKSFKGVLAHMAVWDRPLTKDEVFEAIYFPTQLIQLGVRNNRDSEFLSETQAPTNWSYGEPWWKVSRAVSSENPLKTLSFYLPAYQSELDYVLHLRTSTVGSGGAQSARIQVIVNQHTNSIQTVASAQDYSWFISHAQLNAAATNTLSLLYAGGEGASIAFDTIHFGGSWQLGIENNNNTDFRSENISYTNYTVSLRGMDDWTNQVNRAVSASVSNTVLRFRISAELKARYDFTFVTRIIAQSNPSNTVWQHPWSLALNTGTPMIYNAPNGTVMTNKLDRTLLVAGENRISLTFLGPTNNFNDRFAGGWVQFDYFRLQIAERPKGSLCIVR